MNYEVKDFSVDVIQASHNKPVLVDFWAEWCGPCRVLGPIIERLAAKSNGEWSLVKVNSDEYPEVSAQYGVRSIPNVKLFSKGIVINEFVGALPEPAIFEWLKKNIPNKYHDLLNKAELFLINGNEIKAQEILEQLLNTDPQNGSAKLLMAKILLFKDHKKADELIAKIEETNDNSELITSIKTIANLLNESKNLTSEESATKALFLEAVKYLKDKKFDQSIEKFIEIIKTDRFYADDIARKACIAIFKYLGEENEITLAYRKEFGRALYV